MSMVKTSQQTQIEYLSIIVLNYNIGLLDEVIMQMVKSVSRVHYFVHLHFFIAYNYHSVSGTGNQELLSNSARSSNCPTSCKAFCVWKIQIMDPAQVLVG